jgi:hypothetical protein
MQVDGFFFVCSTVKSYFGALGIVVAEESYSPDTRPTRPTRPSYLRVGTFLSGGGDNPVTQVGTILSPINCRKGN